MAYNDLNTAQTRSSGVANSVSTNKVLRNTYAFIGNDAAFLRSDRWRISGYGYPTNGQHLCVLYRGLRLDVPGSIKRQILRLACWPPSLLPVLWGSHWDPSYSAYLQTLPNGGALIDECAGNDRPYLLWPFSGCVNDEKDFSFLSNFLLAGAIVLVLAMVAGLISTSCPVT